MSDRGQITIEIDRAIKALQALKATLARLPGPLAESGTVVAGPWPKNRHVCRGTERIPGFCAQCGRAI